MLSLEYIATVKNAVVICNDSELKRKILFASDDVNNGSNEYLRKQNWNEMVEKKAMVTLRDRGLPKELQERVMDLVPAIGMRMLTWAYYHEGILGFSREYSIDFLNSTFFTQRGIIDNKRAAKELMNDENLSIEQKYKLACLYCFTDHIPALHWQRKKEDKEKFYSTISHGWVKQPGLVKFWSYYVRGKIKRGKTLDQYRLEKAVESGSKAAVEYCLEKTNSGSKNYAIVNAALEAVRNRIIIENDLIIFCIRDRRYDRGERKWVPNDYYVDIVYFLLSKMNEGQKMEFLKKDIEGVKYERAYWITKDDSRCTVLEYFLDWPYQDYFMETAGLMWEILPERYYAVLLLRICDKIEPEKHDFKYGEEKSHDYRGLLKAFWYQSPERYKRYVLSNKLVVYETYRYVSVETGVGLLSKLLTLKNFTHEDRKNIKLILASATDKEKENIFSSEEWRSIFTGLMMEKREILDRFEQNCFSFKEEAYTFRRELIFTKEAQRIFIDLVKNDEWHAAESCIKWSALPEEEIKQLKKEIIYSADGKSACMDLILYKEDMEVANKIFKWFFSSEEEVREFKKELIFSEVGVGSCSDLVILDKMGLVDEVTNWCLSSQEEIREFKKSFARKIGEFICKNLISDHSEEYIYEGYEEIGLTAKFKGGKWEEVEKFLTGCFPSEVEISDFKKNVLLRNSGVEILCNLIHSNQWDEAETFLAWLELSPEEMKKLKKETLFEKAIEVLHSQENVAFSDFGSKQEAIELLLRWFLTDQGAVLEFNDEFKRRYIDEEITQEGRDALENFDLMIKQRLSDLEEEQRGIKRKSETVTPSKKLCSLKLENRGTECGK